MPTEVADRGALAQHGLVHRLARARVVPGPQPLPDQLELGAVGDVPRVDRGQPGGVEQVTPIASREGGEGDRRVGRPVGGGADLTRAGAVVQRGGDQPDRVDAGRLALVVGGADRGVPLDVLDAAHAGTRRAQHVGDALVALQVDEVVGVVDQAAAGVPDQPQRTGAADRPDVGAGGLAVGAARAGRRRGNRRARTRRGPAPMTCCALDLVAGQEGDQVVAPAQASLPLAVQVHHGAPAARDGDQVAVDGAGLADRGAVGVDGADRGRGHPRVAVGAGHGHAGEHLDLAGPGAPATAPGGRRRPRPPRRRRRPVRRSIG